MTWWERALAPLCGNHQPPDEAKREPYESWPYGVPLDNEAVLPRPGSRQDRRPACKRGHLYSEHGYEHYSGGYLHRQCLACAAERARAKRTAA